MSSKDLRSYIQIVENAYDSIPNTKNTIKVSMSLYDFYRLFQRLGNPDDFTKTNYEAFDRFFTFYTDQEFKKFTQLLHQENIPYSFVRNDNNKEPDFVNKVSPVPKNPWYKK